FKAFLNNNIFLQRSFQQQFISGLLYTFTYNQLSDENKRGQLYLQFNFDMAGNVLSLFGKNHASGLKTFLGLKYAQYAKQDVDLSYHYHLNHSGQVLVGHAFAGLGIPYGNSKAMPFVKQYHAGGPYGVRAFR